jgi:hypothetical protein
MFAFCCHGSFFQERPKMFALITSMLWNPSFNIGLNESHGMRGISFNPDDDVSEERAEGEVTRYGVDALPLVTITAAWRIVAHHPWHVV